VGTRDCALGSMAWLACAGRPPWPLTTFMPSADQFESQIASEYG
jgi:hypothetical protein